MATELPKQDQKWALAISPNWKNPDGLVLIASTPPGRVRFWACNRDGKVRDSNTMEMKLEDFLKHYVRFTHERTRK